RRCGRTVFVSLDGIFNQVNLNSLKNTETGKFVIETQQLILLGNTREVPEYKKNAKKPIAKSMWIFANPNYGSANLVPALPGTQKEAEMIKNTMIPLGYKVGLFTQNQADEKTLKSVSNQGILHVATHGFFLKDEADDGIEDGLAMGIDETKAKENPMLRSGLMLANCEAAIQGSDDKSVKKANNGILTAFEASNLNLDKTAMVVMSACETGLGDVKSGEGVYGLQRAFQVAGADAILMSLWKVNDEATQKLMSLFYKNLSTGLEKQKALRDAQKALLKTMPHPYFWGAFVLLGI
ncbi:MAG: CHAT domain-containing protein, partial [Cytophagales bacterium]